jgi:exodeoxyribonuclease V beta subunit
MSDLRRQLAVLTPGTHVLEASAGTGKTWTITTLIAAALALGRVAPARVLAVTFTRAATAELRVRVRERLVELAALLAQPTADDTVAALVDEELASGGPGSADAARERLRTRLLTALDDADAIAVDTMHGWCATLLGQFGDLLGLEPPAGDVTAALPPVDELTERGTLAAAATAPVAQWLGFTERIAAPEGLAQVARALLAGVEGVELRDEQDVVMDTSPEAVAALEASCRAAESLHARLAADWSANAEAYTEAIERARREDRLNKSKWNDTALARRVPVVSWLLSDLTAYFTLDTDDARQAAYFGTTELAGAVKQGKAPVSLGAFGDDLDALLEMLPVVRAALAVPLATFARVVQAALPRRATDFDDLLRLVAEGLEREPAVARRVRAGADLVLIDESQDTDPLQWRIFATLFHQGPDGKRLVLVGDPKQSIYRFRNAEVAVYLQARAEATGAPHTLDTNFRSDPRLVSAVNTLYEAAGPVFGDGVTFEPVQARRREPELDPPTEAPCTFVTIPTAVTDGGAHRTRAAVADDVAQRIAQVLQARGELRLRRARAGEQPRAVEARDCAVLVSTNAQARLIVQALRQVGVHAVAASRQAVTQGATAQEVAAVLRALESPGDRAALREAALTALLRPALGLDLRAAPATMLEALDGDEGRRLEEALRTARARWTSHGVLDAWITLDHALDLSRHAAAHAEAERRLTDVRHLLELLAAHETRQRALPADTLRWLAERMAERSVDQITAEELEERLESDEDAVHVLTLHASKGLEFPLVWLPFAWAEPRSFHTSVRAPLVRRFEVEHGVVRGLVPVTGGAPSAHPVAVAEQAALQREQQRLLYVALTRARNLCTVYVSDGDRHVASSLGILLGATTAKADATRVMSQCARALAGRGAGIGVEVMGDTAPIARPVDRPVGSDRSSPRGWSRKDPLDTYWRRGSFTALTRGAGHGSGTPATGAAAHALAGRLPHVADQPDADGTLDEARDAAADEGDDLVPCSASRDVVPAPTMSPRVPLADLPRGRAAGNAVHELFERTVPSRAPASLLATLVPEALQRQGLDPVRWSALLTSAIERAFDVPLVGLGASDPATAPRAWPTLRTLATGRCFPELAFDLAVAKGPDATWSRDHVVRARHIARVFRSHPGGAVPDDYADRITALDFVPLRGLLTGTIDLVARYDGRWYLLDYKSNYLGDTVAHYAPPLLTPAMTVHHYVLQYHLYLVALHRFLRARQPDYDYDRHLGGVGYLFVRGLDANHAGAGVFADRPPRARIEALDAVLREGAPR